MSKDDRNLKSRVTGMSDREVQNQILLHSVRQSDSLKAIRSILNFFLVIAILSLFGSLAVVF